jgi:hypothetical protein
LRASSFGAQPQPAQKPHHKPSDLLSVFFRNHLDQILSPIERPVPLPRTRVTELREQFVTQGSKAPETKKPIYVAAVAVCDALSSAMDEREKAIASLQGSLNKISSFQSPNPRRSSAALEAAIVGWSQHRRLRTFCRHAPASVLLIPGLMPK